MTVEGEVDKVLIPHNELISHCLQLLGLGRGHLIKLLLVHLCTVVNV